MVPFEVYQFHASSGVPQPCHLSPVNVAKANAFAHR